MSSPPRYQWPKIFPPLTPEQTQIADDFMAHWHDILAKRYRLLEKFNHHYVIRHSRHPFTSTLEIGAGLGEHLSYEKLSPIQQENYVAIELRENMANKIKARFPWVKVITHDCQRTLDYPDHAFDRILAIHVLEHLPDLPQAIKEIYRLIEKKHGTFLAVIPCEGGLLYQLARRISAQRIFEKRYQQPYQWFIEREHVNVPDEIFSLLTPYFHIIHRHWFPLRLPFLGSNLCIGLTMTPK